MPTVDANHFEFVRALPAPRHGGEAILARKNDEGRVYTVKLVRKSAREADSLAKHMWKERDALKALVARDAPFLARLYWSFDDERAMYLVIVSARSRWVPVRLTAKLTIG